MLYQHDISPVHLHRFLPVHLGQKFRLDNFFINVDINRPEALYKQAKVALDSLLGAGSISGHMH